MCRRRCSLPRTVRSTRTGASRRPASRGRSGTTCARGSTQGGSTITQQYAKNAYLSQERTYKRKLKEFFIAVKLDRRDDKDKILQDYLNTIYFGRGAYGIQTASQTYFGKDVSQLTVAEGAVLASVIRSPAGYDPDSARRSAARPLQLRARRHGQREVAVRRRPRRPAGARRRSTKASPRAAPTTSSWTPCARSSRRRASPTPRSTSAASG